MSPTYGGPSGELILPDFLIVGAMKGGTTSLYFYLRQHPEIFTPEEELAFFHLESNWRKGVEWYSGCFRGYAGERCIGEKSPGYSYHGNAQQRAETAKRIHNLLPKVKLIWCLRNPVDRAYSHYWHIAQNGKVRFQFEDELRRRSPDNTIEHSRIVERGIYLTQIAQYLELFPRDQMHFVVSEDLFANTDETLRGVYEFLGVDPEFQCTKTDEVLASRKRVPRMLRLQGYAYRILRRASPRIAKGFQRRLRNTLSYERPRMSPETRRQLERVYAPRNEELSEFLGVDVAQRWRRRD